MKTRIKIIGDSSLDFDDELNKRLNASIAPLTITVGGTSYLDDGTIEIPKLLYSIASDRNPAKTAAPAPSDFLKYFDEAEEGVFIITLSSKLSASYNSAMIAKQLAAEKYPDIKVCVVDSLAASAGQTTLAIHIAECTDSGMSFEQIEESVLNFRDHDQLFFLLENIDTLVKNGRMSLLKGLLATFLHIKPILMDDGEGNISLKDKSRTTSGAIEKLAQAFYDIELETENRTLVIAECNAIDKAVKLKGIIEEKRKFKDILIVPMFGLSSTYANDGGLVCAC